VLTLSETKLRQTIREGANRASNTNVVPVRDWGRSVAGGVRANRGDGVVVTSARCALVESRLARCCFIGWVYLVGGSCAIDRVGALLCNRKSVVFRYMRSRSRRSRPSRRMVVTWGSEVLFAANRAGGFLGSSLPLVIVVARSLGTGSSVDGRARSQIGDLAGLGFGNASVGRGPEEWVRPRDGAPRMVVCDAPRSGYWLR